MTDTDDPQGDPWGEWKGRSLEDDTPDGWRCPLCERPAGHPLCAVSYDLREVCLLPWNRRRDGGEGDGE